MGDAQRNYEVMMMRVKKRKKVCVTFWIGPRVTETANPTKGASVVPQRGLHSHSVSTAILHEGEAHSADQGHESH